MEFQKTLTVVLLAGLMGFAFGFATKSQIDSEVLEKAVLLLQRASGKIEAVVASRQTCSGEDALRWWTNAANLTEVRGRLCGRKESSAKSSR